MAFKSRISGERLYHHIYAWGNDRHPIFKKDIHYYQYLKLLGVYSNYFGIEVLAYALMKWHVHLFIYDISNRLSDFMMNLHGDYARFYNHLTRRVGHIFGERFNNRIVQPNNYGIWLSRYIHRQAVEAGLVDDPKDYPWTSYRVYIGLEQSTFLKPGIILGQFGMGKEVFCRYEDFVMGKDGGPIDWQRTKQKIIGNDDFIKEVADSNRFELVDELTKPSLDEVVNKILGLDMHLLCQPRGRQARAMRHQVIKVLGLEYKFTKSEIGRAFNISVPAVSKILNK